VPLKLPRARAAALIKSVADGTAAASITPDTAISGAHAEWRETCSARASESESSCVDRECCRRSCGGEHHTRTGDQRCRRRTARVLCRSSFREREQQLRSRALPTQPRRRASHPTQRSAVHMLSGERPMPLKLPRARATVLIESVAVAVAAAAASVTPDRAISGADTEQRAACAAQASERESSSFDRERC
jgi:hypothetical protein